MINIKAFYFLIAFKYLNFSHIDGINIFIVIILIHINYSELLINKK